MFGRRQVVRPPASFRHSGQHVAAEHGAASEARVYVRAEDALATHSLPECDAAIRPHAWFSADLRGIDRHAYKFVPHDLHRPCRGLINPRPSRVTAACCLA